MLCSCVIVCSKVVCSSVILSSVKVCGSVILCSAQVCSCVRLLYYCLNRADESQASGQRTLASLPQQEKAPLSMERLH